MLDDLIPYYERELGYLRYASREFSRRFPRLATSLGLSAEACEDPHVERLIESFALLTARISKKLDDDFPELTEALLEILYPYYLRPFPSCSIAQFDVGEHLKEIQDTVTIERGSCFNARRIQKVVCTFKTVYDVKIAPIQLDRFEYHAAPANLREIAAFPKATGYFDISLQLTDNKLTPKDINLDNLRCYLKGDNTLISKLRDCLFMNVTGALVETRPNNWQVIDKSIIKPCGFDDNESMFDFPMNAHPAYRLLLEYFAFQEKFNFFDLQWRNIVEVLPDSTRINIRLIVDGVGSDTLTARLLEDVSSDTVRLNCTPVINLFETYSAPISVTQKETSYPVLPRDRVHYGYDIYSINKVLEVRRDGSAESVTEIRPFFSLRHGESEHAGGYWTLSRNDEIAHINPGYENMISIVDSEFNPMVPRVDTLSVFMTCTNRDIPSLLSIGQRAGDLLPNTTGVKNAALIEKIQLLRNPTPTKSLAKSRGMHWRLISLLSLNHLSLVETGLPALKETLHLMNLTQSPAFEQLIDGIKDLSYEPSIHWMEGQPFATYIKGVDIRLTLNSAKFVGSSLHTFITVLNHFFGMYVHINSFVRLIILAPDGTEITRFQPCNGNAILI